MSVKELVVFVDAKCVCGCVVRGLNCASCKAPAYLVVVLLMAFCTSEIACAIADDIDEESAPRGSGRPSFVLK